MEMVQTAVTWISWFLAAYIVAVVIFLIANIGIQAVRTKSALWWYLVYSIVVVGMMLAGLQYLPSMFLESVNEGIEASQPEMERLTVNVQRIFNTAASGTGTGTTGSGANATAVPEPTATIDINVGGGLVTAVPVLTTPPLRRQAHRTWRRQAHRMNRITVRQQMHDWQLLRPLRKDTHQQPHRTHFTHPPQS